MSHYREHTKSFATGRDADLTCGIPPAPIYKALPSRGFKLNPDSEVTFGDIHGLLSQLLCAGKSTMVISPKQQLWGLLCNATAIKGW